MTIDNSKFKYENMNTNVDDVYVNEITTISNLNDIIMLQYNNYLVIVTFTFYFFKISKNDNRVILDGKR